MRKLIEISKKLKLIFMDIVEYCTPLNIPSKIHKIHTQIVILL